MSSEGEDEAPGKGPSLFTAFNDSSTSSSEEDEEAAEDVDHYSQVAATSSSSIGLAAPIEGSASNLAQGNAPKVSLQKAGAEDDLVLLEEAIARSRKERNSKDTKWKSKSQAEVVSLFVVSEADLNSDHEVMKQLQAADISGGEAVGSGKSHSAGNKRGGRSRNRKLLRSTFCTPESDWHPLPTFVSGAGVGRQVW